MKKNNSLDDEISETGNAAEEIPVFQSNETIVVFLNEMTRVKEVEEGLYIELKDKSVKLAPDYVLACYISNTEEINGKLKKVWKKEWENLKCQDGTWPFTAAKANYSKIQLLLNNLKFIGTGMGQGVRFELPDRTLINLDYKMVKAVVNAEYKTALWENDGRK